MLFEIRAYSPNTGIQKLEWELLREADAYIQAERQGIEILSIKSVPRSRTRLQLTKANFPCRQFAQELATLNDAGFSLIEALETLIADEKSALYRDVVAGLLKQLKNGSSFSQALSSFSRQFPPLFVESVKASEQTGDIAKTLRRYSDYEARLDLVKNHVIASSVYPFLLLAAGVLVVMFMLGYVVPRLAGAYDSIQGEVPTLSRWLFTWGTLVNEHGAFLGTVLSSAILVLCFWITSGRAGKFFQRTLLQFPLLGEQFRIYHLTRLYRTVGMLLIGGVPMVRALDMSGGILPSNLAAALAVARKNIAEGEAISSAFENAGLTTPIASRMFRAGEKSGTLSEALERVASFHDDRLEQWIRRFIRIFEPALMALIGALIGGIVLLMYMPIFELAGSVG